MIEIVNPSHPDKIADRIAGAIVDLAYFKEASPKIAVEVLIGHGECAVIIESNVKIIKSEIEEIVERIAGPDAYVSYKYVEQDVHLAANQDGKVRCGDNGIFKGMPITNEEHELFKIAQNIYRQYPYDGKYVLDGNKLIICQSNCKSLPEYKNAIFNPLGYWTGGINVDTGATNRKIGSDMGHSITGGGLMGKDCSKADVSVNIYAHLKAQETGKEVNLSCAIGDEEVDGKPYYEIVKIAKNYIDNLGGFEKFAEWGFIK